MSCQNIFQDNDNEYYLLDKQEEKDDLLNGIYSLLADIHNQDYFMLLCRSDDVNAYSYGNYSFSYKNMNGIEQKCAGVGSPYDFGNVSDAIYMKLYTAIITINRILSEISADEEPELIGELYFLRGYCYFKLARFFGTPLLVEDTDVDYSLSKPTYTEVYEFIESDILNAIRFLPVSYSDVRILGETPHKGTAKALLAEIYLSWAGFPVNDKEKYSSAAQVAEEVIENANDYNFDLLDDMADLWKTDNSHNMENIFSLFFNNKNYKTKNRINSVGLAKVSDYYSKLTYITFMSSYNPNIKFYNTFPNNYRKQISIITGIYYSNSFYSPDSTYTGMQFIPFDPINSPCEYVSEAHYLKWIDLDLAYKYNFFYSVDMGSPTLCIIRYAQTLLTFAEAKARSGNLDQSCYDAINKIRRRANHVDLSAPSRFDLPQNLTAKQFIDSTVLERAWELCFEPEGRWFDIIRLDLKDQLLEGKTNPKDFPSVIPSEYLTDDWYFYKIPQEDRWLNPNLE